MIDTNQVQQVADTASAIKVQVSSWWPTLAPLAYILGREVRAFNAWLLNVAEFVIRHGGLGRIVVKLLWSPDSDQDRLAPPSAQTVREDALKRLEIDLAQEAELAKTGVKPQPLNLPANAVAETYRPQN